MDNKQLKYGIFMTYGMGLIQILVNMVFTAVLARCLGQVEYGLYLLLGSIVSYISTFDFGLNNTTSRYIAKYRVEENKKKESNLISTTMLFYLIIALLIFTVGLILRENLIYFVKDVTSEYMVLAKNLFLLLIINLAITLPLNSFAAVLVGYEKFIYTRLVSIIRILVVPILSIPLLYLGRGSMAVVIITTLSNILAGSANLFYVIKKLKIKIRLFYFEKDFIKEIFGYSSFVFLGVVAEELIWNTGNIVIGMNGNPAVISIYGIATQLCFYLMAMISSMTGVFLPKTTVLVTSGASKDEITDHFIKIGRIQTIMICLIVGGFFTIGMSFVYFWLGDDYLPAYYITCMIFIPLSIILSKSMGVNILQAKNMHAYRSIIMLITGIPNLIISYFAAKYYGIIAVAICHTVTLLVNSFLLDLYYYFEAEIDIIKYYKSNLKIVISMVIPVIFLVFWGSYNSMILLIIKGILFIGSYFIVLWLITLNKFEKLQVENFFNKLIKHNYLAKRLIYI